MQVHIVRKKIGLFGQQVFRGGKVCISRQRPLVLVFDDPHQGVEEPLHPLRPIPPDQIGGDFVVDVVAQSRGMAGSPFGRTANTGPDFPADGSVVEKKHPPLPGDGHHHPQSVFPRHIEEPGRGRMVNPEHVEPCRRHQTEIPPGFLRRAQVILAIPERPVGDSLDEKLVFPAKKEFPAHLDARPAQSGGVARGKTHSRN